MEIKDHILTLISKEEMAYVPGLGGFISNKNSARLDSSTQIFYPPTKILAFNNRLVATDTKLAESIALHTACTIEKAKEEIESFVNTITTALSTNKRYDWDGIGTLIAEDDNLIFQDKHSASADAQNFGLPSILIKNIAKEHKKNHLTKPKDRNAMSTLDLHSVPDPASPGDNPSIHEFEGKPKSTNSLTWLYVLTPVVLFGIFGIFLGVSEDGKKMLASMHVVSSSSEVETEPSGKVDTEIANIENRDSDPFTGSVSAEEKIKETENETWGETPTKSPQETIAKSNDVEFSTANILNGKSGRYFVIGGSFAKKRNAVKLREKLINEGLESKIIAPTSKGGMYRVSLTDLASKESAIQKLEDLKTTYGDNIWVISY